MGHNAAHAVRGDVAQVTSRPEGERIAVCRSGCRTRDHASWGECLRAASVRTYLASPSKGLDGTAQKKWDQELELYRQARKQGIQPDGTKTNQIVKALKASDAAGAAYGRDFSKADPMPEGA